MAAAIAGVAEGALAQLLGAGATSQLERTILGGLLGVGAGKLLQAVATDLSGGNPSAVARARRVPQYAIVDMHSDKVVRFLSSRKVYSILTHPSRRGKRGSRGSRVVVLEPEQRLVSVK